MLSRYAAVPMRARHVLRARIRRGYVTMRRTSARECVHVERDHRAPMMARPRGSAHDERRARYAEIRRG